MGMASSRKPLTSISAREKDAEIEGCMWLVIKKIMSEIKCMSRLHHRLCSATSLDWLLSINFEVLSTKISSHVNYPPYGTNFCHKTGYPSRALHGICALSTC